MFRALLIGWLAQYFKSKASLSVLLAAAFAGAHFALYRYSDPLHISLSWTALGTLFLAGLALNGMYLAVNHVGFSWAFHAGWNVVWLPTIMFDAATNEQLRKPHLFDRMLGSSQMLLLPALVAFVTIGLSIVQANFKAGNERAAKNTRQ